MDAMAVASVEKMAKKMRVAADVPKATNQQCQFDPVSYRSNTWLCFKAFSLAFHFTQS